MTPKPHALGMMVLKNLWTFVVSTVHNTFLGPAGVPGELLWGPDLVSKVYSYHVGTPQIPNHGSQSKNPKVYES